MSMTGKTIAPLFSIARREVPKLCREIAEHGGDRATTLTKMNTPIGWVPFFTGRIPGTLRDSITQKILVVYMTPRGLVYESGCETNVKYAPWIEEGWGLYGEYRRKYLIKPRDPMGWLSWINQETGERMYAKKVLHPGSPGQHMFAIGAHMTEVEVMLFAARMQHSWARRVEREYMAIPPRHVGVRA